MRYFGFFLFLPCFIFGDPCKDIRLFNDEQAKTIQYAYDYGKKHGLGYTMAAIAWKESCAGLYRFNFDDPSAGIYHAYLPSVIKRHYNSKNTSFTRNAVAEKLIRDNDFASQVALDELLYWKKVRKGDWKAMIKSYNKGYSWEKSKKRNEIAEAYYEDIEQKVKVLKEYFADPLKFLQAKQENMDFKLLRE